jgi:hypothetical protein
MAEKFNTTLRNALADAFGNGFDAGTLVIYSGAQPTNGGDSPTGTVLATITLPADAFAAAASGAVAKSGTWSDSSADNTGTAGWFRMTGPGGTPNIFDGAVTATSGGGEIEIDSTSIVQGGVVTVNTFTFTQPAA